MRPRLLFERRKHRKDERGGFGFETFSRIDAIWLFGRATWRIRPRRVVPRGGRASRLDASRYRAGEPPNGGKRFRAYHVLHDHLGGEVFLDGGGRHRRDRGCIRECAAGRVTKSRVSQCVANRTQPPRLRARGGRRKRASRLARAFRRRRGRLRTTVVDRGGTLPHAQQLYSL